MRTRQIRHIIIIGALALIGIVVIQVHWLFTTWEMNKEKLKQDIWLSLKEVTQTMNRIHDCAYNELNPVQEITESCFVIDVSCEFSMANLEHTVKTVFNQKHLNIEYQLAAYNCNTNSTEYLGLFSPENEFPDTTVIMPDCMQQSHEGLVYFFVINISGQNFYLFQQIKLWILMSFIVLVIVVFFTYTILSFYNQKQLTELQKDFINNMTHELKTPISSIAISCEVLNEYKNDIPERMYNYTNIIRHENERLNHLVENVLRSAKIEKGRTIMDMEEVNIHQVISEICTNNSFTGYKKSINFTKQLNAEVALINADKMHFTNLLFNLIDNAIKYNNEEVNINIDTKSVKKYLLLEIEDNGIGIADQYRQKVLKKFFRVPTGDLHNVKGFGLGLFYVNRVCKAHGWKLIIKSVLNKGTCIGIKISVNYEK